MPVVVVEVVAGLDVHAQGTAARLVLELQLRATDDAQLDVVRGPLGVEQHRIFDGRLELQVDVARVAHVEAGQVESGVRNAERDHVVEEICGGN